MSIFSSACASNSNYLRPGPLLPVVNTSVQDESEDKASKNSVVEAKGEELSESSFPERSEPLAEEKKVIEETIKDAPLRKKPPVKSFPKGVRPVSVFDAINRYGHDEDFIPQDNHQDFTATAAPAGSREKLDILAERARRGFPLWHENDKTGYEGLEGVVRPRA